MRSGRRTSYVERGSNVFAFEVSSNHGSARFKDEDDAVNALWLIGLYHSFDINREVVKRALDKERYYEKGPVSITKTKF